VFDKILTISFFSALLSGSSFHTEDKAFSDKFGITSEQREAALSGSKEAAVEICNALAMHPYKLNSLEHASDYWLRIAAENGDAVSQANYAAAILNKSRTRDSLLRAKFWYSKASQHGVKFADEEIKLIQDELAKQKQR
jgi:TPR repeat protein